MLAELAAQGNMDAATLEATVNTVSLAPPHPY